MEQIAIDRRNEHFRVYGRNGSILIESNGPLFRSKGLKKRRPDFKIVEGKLSNVAFAANLFEAITETIDSLTSKA